MAEKNDGGDKTEKPTSKRLRDARKRGEAPKSKDATSALTLFAWIACGAALGPFVLDHLARPLDLALAFVRRPSPEGMEAVGYAAAQALGLALAVLLGPVIVVGLLAEFAQAGPVLSPERLKLRFDHMNPGEGLKRMFSTDNLFEVAKSLVKAAVVAGAGWLIAASRFRDLAALAQGGPGGVLEAMGATLRELFLFCGLALALTAAIDLLYQRFSFTKKMRMSRRDLRQEHKETEGDPLIRRQRRQLHQEWSSRTAVQAARSATALVVNPTHVAVALDYDPEEHPAPIVTAKGYDRLAAAMREAAEEEGVPVIRNVAVARALSARAVLDDVVPQDLFNAVAEVIVWARRIKAEAARRAEQAAETEAAP